MPEDVMLKEAIEAIRQGQQSRARDLLTRLLRADPNNAGYWIWMSAVVESEREQIFCLKKAADFDPKSREARQGLRLLGVIPAEGEVKPAPLVRRQWQVELQQVREAGVLGRMWANPVARLAVLSTCALAIIVLVGLGLFYRAPQRKTTSAVIPTRTAGPTPTYTLTPTAINETPFLPTAQPTFEGVPPLWARLEATYTPTPVYVNTPHASNESFRLAQQAFEKGDFPEAITYFRQAEQVDPTAADIPFFKGEILRQMGDDLGAKAAYEQALQIDGGFAPALVGLARVKRSLNPQAEVRGELERAIQSDPGWFESYLELADLLIEKGEAEQALEVLVGSESSAAHSARYYLLRAQANVALGNEEQALEDARRANQMDATSLESFRLLAYAAALNEDYDTAMEAVQVFLDYEDRDPTAWMIQGRALYGEGKYHQALESLERALELDKKLKEAQLYRGLTLLELGDGQQAVNDIYIVQQTDPRSFSLNLYLGRALLSSGRLGDALAQMNRAFDLAASDKEKGEARYYRALTYEEIGNLVSAVRDWKALIELPEGSVPEEWLETARIHITTTSTPVPTATRIPTATRTPTLTRTPKHTLTPEATELLGGAAKSPTATSH